MICHFTSFLLNPQHENISLVHLILRGVPRPTPPDRASWMRCYIYFKHCSPALHTTFKFRILNVLQPTFNPSTFSSSTYNIGILNDVQRDIRQSNPLMVSRSIYNIFYSNVECCAARHTKLDTRPRPAPPPHPAPSHAKVVWTQSCYFAHKGYELGRVICIGKVGLTSLSLRSVIFGREKTMVLL